MIDGTQTARSEPGEIALLPATRRDGEVTCAVFNRAGLHCVVCPDMRSLAKTVTQPLDVILMTDAALLDPEIRQVVAALDLQPDWSDVPLILLTQGDLPTSSAATLAQFTNVTVLDRPTSSRSLVSAVQTAIRGRSRQYLIRDQLESLRNAEQERRQADRRKDEFLATLAHELRNPLAPISTGLQVLEQTSPDASAARKVRSMMRRQLVQLVHIVDDLLDVSRISSGKVVLRRERTSLKTVVDGAVEACRPLIDSARHQLVLALPDEDLWVDGDPARLAQVVSNLINNAAKYTAPGGRVELSLVRERDCAVIRISDTGIGIPPEMLERVFEMFTQVNDTLDRSQGGLGIGLSLVKSLILLHGGTVEAASGGLGRGSTFTLRLPTASAPDAKALAANAGVNGLPQRPMRIVVIDDNHDVGDSLAMLLESYGHQVRAEYDPLDGIRTLDGFHPDIVFCDIGLPSISGYEVARRIRQTKTISRPYLVAVTGWGSPDDKIRADDAGFDAHLTKPANAEALQALLQQVSEKISTPQTN